MGGYNPVILYHRGSCGLQIPPTFFLQGVFLILEVNPVVGHFRCRFPPLLCPEIPQRTASATGDAEDQPRGDSSSGRDAEVPLCVLKSQASVRLTRFCFVLVGVFAKGK